LEHLALGHFCEGWMNVHQMKVPGGES
jgi:hypothetical protein